MVGKSCSQDNIYNILIRNELGARHALVPPSAAGRDGRVVVRGRTSALEEGATQGGAERSACGQEHPIRASLDRPGQGLSAALRPLRCRTRQDLQEAAPIPIPSRGYWAKVKAGRVMNKVPLPPLRASVRWFDIVRQPRNRLSTCERLLFGTDGRRMRYWGN